jgi:hypothetical protein
LLQYTNSQLETFWTLQVRVVIVDDGLYQAAWYTMDGLNRKRCIRNLIWIESTININLIKPCYPYPSRYWRIELGVQYVTKLKSYLSNPAYDCVFNPLYEKVYDKQPNTIQPFGLRVKLHFENSDINVDNIAPIVIPENPPWLNPKPHTHSQMETFWTLQVRVVILDDGLYQTIWYTMDGLNRKRCIRNPILIESTIYINLIKPCYPHPSWYWTQILKY